MKAEEILTGACAEEFGADISARADLSALNRFSIAYTGQQSVCGKEGVNRTRMTRTSADHRG
jgi:hypothetical protein